MARTPSRPRPTVDAEVARAAFESLSAQINAYALPEGFTSPDLKAVTNAALELSALVEEPTLRPRFDKLPEAEFDALTVDELTAMARSLQHCATELEAASEARGEVVLPEALVTHAVDLRTRMLKVAIHYFEDDTDLAADIKALGRKKGYAPMVTDLQKLASIYEARKDVVERDPKYWRASDADDAKKTATEMEKALSDARGEAEKRFSEASVKLSAMVVPVFEEVRATALWLLRKDGGAEKVGTMPSVRVRKPRAEKSEGGDKAETHETANGVSEAPLPA